MKDIQKDLLRKGYSLQFFPQYQDVTDLVQDTWKHFASLPTKEKKQIPYIHGSGYEFKGKKETFDEKDNFHFMKSDMSRYKLEAQKMSPHAKTIFLDYIDACKNAFNVYESCMREICAELVPLIGEEKANLMIECAESTDNWVQRSLYYHSNQNEERDIAKAHPDKSLVTIATQGSAPGLEILDIHSKEWKKIHIPPGSILIMMGLQGQYLVKSKIPALCHRVVNSHQAIFEGRFAHVFFATLMSRKRYNKQKHGSTQKKPPGFNYGGDHKKFLFEYE